MKPEGSNKGKATVRDIVSVALFLRYSTTVIRD
jgi:hypothetical protein